MSREIKFRAWDFDNKKMFFQSVFCVIDGQNVFKLDPHQVDNKYYKLNFEGRFAIQEFTGNTTKDGTEIWEGDNMQIKLPVGGFWGEVEQQKIGTVIYEPYHGGFVVRWEYSNNQHHINLDEEIAYTGTVIGNIYEGNF